MSSSGITAKPTAIDGLFEITIKEAGDERGVVREFFRPSAWAEAGLPEVGPWQQVNVTETLQGALRGLHGEAMTKLVGVVAGEGFGAYVDARHDSPTFGEVVTRFLYPGMQILVPRGVCNGFQSVSAGPSQYLYCFDGEWKPDMPGVSVNAFDPELDIEWPVEFELSDRGFISDKDVWLPSFAEATAR